MKPKLPQANRKLIRDKGMVLHLMLLKQGYSESEASELAARLLERLMLEQLADPIKLEQLNTHLAQRLYEMLSQTNRMADEREDSEEFWPFGRILHVLNPIQKKIWEVNMRNMEHRELSMLVNFSESRLEFEMSRIRRLLKREIRRISKSKDISTHYFLTR